MTNLEIALIILCMFSAAVGYCVHAMMHDAAEHSKETDDEQAAILREQQQRRRRHDENIYRSTR